MLPQEDSLPSAQRQPSPEQRNRHRRRGESGLDVGGHVIRPFRSVGVERVAFGNQAREPTLEIASSRGICVLLEGQTRGRVRNEDRTQAVFAPELCHGRTHFTRNFVEALAVDAQREFERAHRQWANRSRAMEETWISSVPA